MLIRLANQVLGTIGWELQKKNTGLPADMASDKGFTKLYADVKAFTMTSPERLYALYQAVRYTIQNGLPGAFVECGVWKGGSSMMIALTLKQLGITDRALYLYDTFEGMSEPTNLDRTIDGSDASTLLQTSDKSAGIWAYSTLEEVQANMATTGYPVDLIHFVKGKVEDTIPGTIPETISLLRLDTDWYESTRHELQYLYPLLVNNGALIIDDFGHWEGAKKAVIEYLENNAIHTCLHRIDYTGRIMIKSHL